MLERLETHRNHQKSRTHPYKHNTHCACAACACGGVRACAETHYLGELVKDAHGLVVVLVHDIWRHFLCVATI
jgi:hypothetical protein